MPTITVLTQRLTEPMLRRFALRTTRWFKDRDVEPSHVVVSAQELKLPIYTGATPRTGTSAAVICKIGKHRDASFLSDLAEELTDCLRELISADWIQVTFERHVAADTYIFDGKSLWNAKNSSERLLKENRQERY